MKGKIKAKENILFEEKEEEEEEEKHHFALYTFKLLIKCYLKQIRVRNVLFVQLVFYKVAFLLM